MSRFILVATTLAVTVAGCDRFPDNGLQIAAMLPPNDSCVFVADADLRLLAGRYDVAVPEDYDYIIAPLLQSYLITNALEFQGEQANLQVTNFQITLLLQDGTKLDLPENPYRVSTSAVIPANQTRGAVSQAVAAGIGIPASYKDALAAITPAGGSTTILLDVRAIGTTYGGFTQRSPTFTWPVELCDGCSRTIAVCTSEEAEAICLPGQDGNPYCESVVPAATP
ncbi:MAG: hypothetical protein WCE62_16640 [Polyangiales bacterium]